MATPTESSKCFCPCKPPEARTGWRRFLPWRYRWIRHGLAVSAAFSRLPPLFVLSSPPLSLVLGVSSFRKLPIQPSRPPLPGADPNF